MTAAPFAYLFPGQGSQKPGMGQALSEAFALSREIFETADRVLERPLSTLCFEGSADDLALTENTQPSILTVSVAALRELESRGLRASAAAGHSLGEYSAHVAAGTLRFEDAVSTVQARGQFMQQAVPVGEGAMAAVLGLDPQQVDRICRECADGQVVSPANLNGPAQVVVAGHTEAVQRVMQAAQEAGARRVLALPVSAPFHCTMMQPAADRLQALLDSTEFRDPALPVYTNVDACPVKDGATARDALVRQVASPVRWQESIEAMLADGIETFVEVGPGKVLSGLVRGIRRDAKTYQVGDADALERVVQELTA